MGSAIDRDRNRTTCPARPCRPIAASPNPAWSRRTVVTPARANPETILSICRRITAIIIADAHSHYSTISRSLPNDGTHATNIGRWVTPVGVTFAHSYGIVGCYWRVLIAVHGGMKTYRGSPAAARALCGGRPGRADDYYLAEGTGIAEHYVASPDGGVRRLAPLTGDAYEAWVAGCRPGDRRAERPPAQRRERGAFRRGRRQRTEVVVAGRGIAPRYRCRVRRRAGPRPRSRSSAGWRITRPPASVRAVGRCRCRSTGSRPSTVRHHTSRAGDPHRHLHLQINARVFAEGRWRGLHTVGCATLSTRSTASGTPR